MFAYDGTVEGWDTYAIATLYITWLLGSSGSIPSFGAGVAIDSASTSTIVGASDPTAYVYAYKNSLIEVNAPSGVPSTAPTAYPTRAVDDHTVLEWEAASTLDKDAMDGGLGVHYVSSKTFTGLGKKADAWYLSLSVYNTGFGPASSTGQYVRFYVNDVVISAFQGQNRTLGTLECAPIAPSEPILYGELDEEGGCSDGFTSCIVNLDVSKKLLTAQGGSIRVSTRSFGVVSSPCPYGGDETGSVVYIKAVLSSSPQATNPPSLAPSALPTSSPTSNQALSTASRLNKLSLKGWEQLQVVLALGVVLAGLGVAVAKSKTANKALYSHSLGYSALLWGCIGAEMASLWTVVVILFSHGYGDLACSLLVFLLLKMVLGLFLSWETYSGSSHNFLHLSAYLVTTSGSDIEGDTGLSAPVPVSAEQGRGSIIYYLVVALTTLDPAFVAFFPWKDGPFLRQTYGYPNNLVYFLVQVSTVILAGVYLAIELSYLGQGASAGFNAERDLVLVLSVLLLGGRALCVLAAVYYKVKRGGVEEDSVVGAAAGDIEMSDVAPSSPSSSLQVVDSIPGSGANPLHADEDNSFLTQKMALIETENRQLAARLSHLEDYVKVSQQAVRLPTEEQAEEFDDEDEDEDEDEEAVVDLQEMGERKL